MTSSLQAVSLRIAPTSVAALVATLESIAVHPHADVTVVADFAGLGVSTTNRALSALQSLGLADRDAQNRFVSNAIGIRRGGDPAATREAIRRALISFRPFEALCEGLALGEETAAATRRAAILLNIHREDVGRFKTLIQWGRDLGLLMIKDGLLQPSFDSGFGAFGSGESAIIAVSDVESEIKARLHIATRLGREAYDSLDENERRLLALSLVEYFHDPEDAVEKAGQAVEDFLREVAKVAGLQAEAAKLNGAGQLAAMLVSRGVLHSHHQKLIDVVGTLRNAKSHNKDKKTLVPWEITPNASFLAINSAITVVRSIYYFTIHQKQSL